VKMPRCNNIGYSYCKDLQIHKSPPQLATIWIDV
jgi:hypothetical protein